MCRRQQQDHEPKPRGTEIAMKKLTREPAIGANAGWGEIPRMTHPDHHGPATTIRREPSCVDVPSVPPSSLRRDDEVDAFLTERNELRGAGLFGL